MELLKQRNHNKIQRVGFFTAITSVLLVVFIHFPFNGYYTHQNGERCLESWPAYIGGGCKEYEQIMRPFLEWYSTGAIVGWFGDMTNFLVTISLIFIIGFLWLYMFKEGANEK